MLGDLSVGDRQKIMTICTIDVHSRDVVAKMITQKVENSAAFQWQSQLRHRYTNKNINLNLLVYLFTCSSIQESNVTKCLSLILIKQMNSFQMVAKGVFSLCLVMSVTRF